MPRTMSEPFYSLLNKQGRRDIKWAIKHKQLDWYLIEDIIHATVFSVRFRIKKLFRKASSTLMNIKIKGGKL